MRIEDLSDEALALLRQIQQGKFARHFDANAGWELIVCGLANIKQDPFRIEITSEGEALSPVS